MVLEQFLESEAAKRHVLFIFFIGFIYVIVGYIVANLFFGSSASLVALFTTTLLLVPAVTKLIDREEDIVGKEGIRHFFRNNHSIMQVYIALFLGIFLAFFVLAYFVDIEDSMSYQLNFLKQTEKLSAETINDFAKTSYQPTFDNFLGLVSYNLAVVVICFILSFFYGAGALFLITLNASVFSTFIVFVIKHISKWSVFGLFMIHLLPELAGFLIASIAGGVISRSIMHERFRGQTFSNVVKDALILFLIAVGLIIIAAALEVFVTSQILHNILS